MRMTRGLENISYEDILRELELFNPVMGRVQGDFIARFQYLEGLYRVGDQLFTRTWSDRTKGKAFTQKDSQFKLAVTKNVYTLCVVGQCEKFPIEVMDAP